MKSTKDIWTKEAWAGYDPDAESQHGPPSDRETLHDTVDSTGRKLNWTTEDREGFEQDFNMSFDSDVITPDQFDRVLQWLQEEDKIEALDDEQKLANVLAWQWRKITCVDDISRFFDALSACLNWHPDTDFDDYIQLNTEKPTFTHKQAKALNALMQECFNLSQDRDSADVYELAVRSAQKAGWMPKPDEASKELTELRAVLRALCEHLIEGRNDPDHRNAAGIVHGGIADELLMRADRALGRDLPPWS